MRIAMWSGPRNLSTAMMYSFGARPDCAVIDEPFYAAYLSEAGLHHPMRAEILAAQSTDPAQVVHEIKGPIPGGKAHFYQKHMAHHILPDFPTDWMRDLVNVFLIRHPARVIASYAAKRENPTLQDIAFEQQSSLLETVSEEGGKPIVIDSFDIRANPSTAIEGLCDSIGIPFFPEMLAWKAGGHPADGVWASHWYGAVWRSTGFAGAEGSVPEVPQHLKPVLDAAMPYYEAMSAQKL